MPENKFFEISISEYEEANRRPIVDDCPLCKAGVPFKTQRVGDSSSSWEEDYLKSGVTFKLK